MTWIDTIPPDAAEGRLKTLYARVADASGQVDNILIAHSLRPHTLEGHMALYKSVLHHFGNRCDAALLETVGVAVSLWNGCRYCVEHHRAGLARLLADEARATAIAEAIAAGRPQEVLDAKTVAALTYAEKLTRDPAGVSETDIESLRAAGFSDGEILEINQVAAYFAYANRTVLGLGVDAAGERLGLAPKASGSPTDWRHR